MSVSEQDKTYSFLVGLVTVIGIVITGITLVVTGVVGKDKLIAFLNESSVLESRLTIAINLFFVITVLLGLIVILEITDRINSYRDKLKARK